MLFLSNNLHDLTKIHIQCSYELHLSFHSRFEGTLCFGWESNVKTMQDKGNMEFCNRFSSVICHSRP